MSSYRSIRYFDGQLLRIRGVKSTELGMAVKLAIFEVPGVLLLMGHMQKVYLLLHSITILLTLAPEEVVGGPFSFPQHSLNYHWFTQEGIWQSGLPQSQDTGLSTSCWVPTTILTYNFHIYIWAFIPIIHRGKSVWQGNRMESSYGILYVGRTYYPLFL